MINSLITDNFLVVITQYDQNVQEKNIKEERLMLSKTKLFVHF